MKNMKISLQEKSKDKKSNSQFILVGILIAVAIFSLDPE
jgi:hypothetical protein